MTSKTWQIGQKGSPQIQHLQKSNKRAKKPRISVTKAHWNNCTFTRPLNPRCHDELEHYTTMNDAPARLITTASLATSKLRSFPAGTDVTNTALPMTRTLHTSDMVFCESCHGLYANNSSELPNHYHLHSSCVVNLPVHRREVCQVTLWCATNSDEC